MLYQCVKSDAGFFAGFFTVIHVLQVFFLLDWNDVIIAVKVVIYAGG